MYIIRFLGIIFALIVSFVASLIFKIDFPTILAIFAFIFAADSAVLRIVSDIYMKSILNEMEKVEKQEDKKHE